MKLPLVSAILLSLTFLNIASYLSLSGAFNTQKVLGASIEQPIPEPRLTEELNFWKKIVSENPTYIDGYLKLAILEKQIGNTGESNNYINQAFKIDPNSLKIREISGKLK
ncbi:MAG: hypothetical protein HY044_01085 [Candidatus Woesebacteria bacterium]|nr:MAG: hypothetical protein HY044_01085 [Candidatus Woesebacteria bacterium]